MFILITPPNNLPVLLISRIIPLPGPGLHKGTMVDIHIQSVSGGRVVLTVIRKELPNGIRQQQGISE